jgi:hypothetical protein
MSEWEALYDLAIFVKTTQQAVYVENNHVHSLIRSIKV